MPGSIALVGGLEWTSGCEFDRELVESSGATEIIVLPTAAAFEGPAQACDNATRWFEGLGVGAKVKPLMVLTRTGAQDTEAARTVREARFVYLSGGSPLHLRSVLKETVLWDALCDAYVDGATVAGSSAGAMVLGDPMVDPRGGAYTLGLGLVPGLAVLPHADTWSADKVHRTLRMAPEGVVVAAIAERSALVLSAQGTWSAHGSVTCHRRHAEVALSAVPVPEVRPSR